MTQEEQPVIGLPVSLTYGYLQESHAIANVTARCAIYNLGSISNRFRDCGFLSCWVTPHLFNPNF